MSNPQSPRQTLRALTFSPPLHGTSSNREVSQVMLLSQYEYLRKTFIQDRLVWVSFSDNEIANLARRHIVLHPGLNYLDAPTLYALKIDPVYTLRLFDLTLSHLQQTQTLLYPRGINDIRSPVYAR